MTARPMRIFLFLGLILPLLAISAPSAAAAIDCADPSNEAAALLCEDPLLAKLQDALGDAEADAGLKAWLADAKKRCRFADDGSIPPAAAWTAVPCLIAAYQVKVKAVHGRLDDELASRIGLDLPVVHPLCVKLATTPEKAEAERAADALVPVRDCNRRFSHLDIDNADNMLTAEAPGDTDAGAAS